MARPKSLHPTELELQILKVLWDRSPLPVREIRQALADGGRDLAHTSVITTLGVMVRKRYLRRTKQGNAFLFAPESRGTTCPMAWLAIWSIVFLMARQRP